MECNADTIQFDTVKEAMRNVGITLTDKKDTSLLVWRDSLSHLINYGKIHPWQVINRIPFSNILCRKVPLSIILREGQLIFPNYYDFFPETFILPNEFDIFQESLIKIRQKALKKEMLKRKNKIRIFRNNDCDILNEMKLIKLYSQDKRSNSCDSKYNLNNHKLSKDIKIKSDDEISLTNGELNPKDEFLVKPSNGSLGKGIKIIQTGEIVDKNSYCEALFKNQKNPSKQCPAVAQKYIKSHLINGTKFDLRIYVLISSVDPFEIFVYRDGLARFCSLKAICSSRFARITNVTMNKESFFFKKPEQISKLISDVFDENFTEQQQAKIWSEIDDLIVLTLFCSHRYLSKGKEKFLPSFCREKCELPYSKCFQIFGFDILLREGDLKPFLIEINYRPSLDFLRNCERRMKVDVISGALQIAAPFALFQELVNARKFSCDMDLWKGEINSHPELFERTKKLKKEAMIYHSKYERIWPPKKDKRKENSQKYRMFSEILNKLDQQIINDELVRI